MSKSIALLTLILGLFAAGSATATVSFDVAGAPSSHVNISNHDCVGLACTAPQASLSAGLDGTTFDLDVGETFSFDFFTMSFGGLFTAGSFDIAATLAFDTPGGVSGTASGQGGYLTINGSINSATLTLSMQPALLADSFGNIFSLVIGSADDLDVRPPGTVRATVGLVSEIPEPASMATLLVGLAGFGFASRRR